MASLSHEQAHGLFPTGGFPAPDPNENRVGDPDLGIGDGQTGGWVFNLLPYKEQQPLHDLGAGLNATAKMPLFAQREQTPLAAMSCPSRRPAGTRPFIYPSHQPTNCTTLTLAAKGDYAGNSGDVPYSPTAILTGVIFWKSQIRAADISDGFSNVYLLGEKSLTPHSPGYCNLRFWLARRLSG